MISSLFSRVSACQSVCQDFIIYVLYMVLVFECACWRPMKAREDRKGCWIMNACLDMREPWRQKSEHDRRSCNLLLIMIINYLSCYYSRKSQSMFILRVSTPYTTMQVATMKRISSNSNYNSESSSSLRYVLGNNIPYESSVAAARQRLIFLQLE